MHGLQIAQCGGGTVPVERAGEAPLLTRFTIQDLGGWSALGSAGLAIAYDSLPLAILATLGAFMNPYFMAADEPVGALTPMELAIPGDPSAAAFFESNSPAIFSTNSALVTWELLLRKVRDGAEANNGSRRLFAVP